ncbi:MAG: hypothetical protein VKO44_07005, partial [Cyanobacteriota bacterium]|nr:hypothetical protein [Cyanobacteriota bacterium]
VNRLQMCLKEVAAGRPLLEPCGGKAQSIRDREILEFLGESVASSPAASSREEGQAGPEPP